MAQRNKQVPTTWNAFEHGRASSFGSLESIHEDEHGKATRVPTSQSYASRVPQSNDGATESDPGLRRRRSSIAMRFDSIRQMGGPNSIDNFVNSFQRAAGFRQIGTVRKGSVTGRSSAEEEEEGVIARPRARQPLTSILSQQIRGSPPQPQSTSEEVQPAQVEAVAQFEPTEATTLLSATTHDPLQSFRSRLDSEQSLGVSYGSISARLSQSARRRASVLIDEQIEASQRAREQPEEFKDDDLDRPTETEVRPDGEVVERTVGESTVPMTIFNSTNVLIGVGILALPLGIRYAGWIIGLLILTLAALVTAYTATILAKCLDTNTASTTYGDIAFLAFDTWGRGFVEALFSLELVAANVALIILFADSMSSLIPAVSVVAWKFVVAIGLLPLNFAAFKTLSITSVLGIGCTLGIFILVVVDGFLKPHAPGSLREMATTYAFPADFRTVPLSIGLIIAPWGGHSVFPAIYKDMRHPKKYGQAVRSTYTFTYSLDLAMGVLGYLMFGDTVRDEITANIITSKDYPKAISVIIVVLIAIIPITKIPLTNRPIMDTINKKFLIDLRQMDAKARQYSEKSFKHRLGRASVGIFANLLQLGIAIIFPDFDSIMALMGSALCLTICILLPIAFYLKIFWGGKEIGLLEKTLCFVLLVFGTIFAALGTAFAIMPKEKLGLQANCVGKIGCF